LRRLLIRADPPALAAAAAAEFARAAAACKGEFRVALSGGATPRALYQLLASDKAPYRAAVPWDRLRFYWGDERCVPPDDPDSNYRMAYDALLSRVPARAGSIRRIDGELDDPEESARLYADTLRRELGPAPRFDWVFLGLGADGHTASLFPGTPAAAERTLLARGVRVVAKPSKRVTLTLPVFNAAKTVVFLVAGADKAETVRRVLGEPPSEDLPASLVAPASGDLIWMLDAGAASKIPPFGAETSFI
jgi:6-phosphogluconolactonase